MSIVTHVATVNCSTVDFSACSSAYRYINVTCGDAKKAKYQFMMESGLLDGIFGFNFASSADKVAIGTQSLNFLTRTWF